MRVTILFIAIVFSFSVRSQDVIFLKNGSVKSTKISEIKQDEIVYKNYNNLNGPNYHINKALVSKIIFENGEVEIFENMVSKKELTAKKRVLN